MDYPYENLSPEKFQLFCQALLAKEHPNIQCMPVAQPDGGRDAMQILFEPHYNKEIGVFQVKFVRKPHAEQDAHNWLHAVLTDELPNIRSQIPRGAKFYILITNVPGTAHPDSGSIDRVNTLLKSLGVPTMCWWRNDLNRRLDDAWNLKWSYPELMTGPDLIRLVIESGLSENRERRSNAIRTFVAHQFTLDEEVKFKQVDLQNRLLELFIDVPLASGTRWANRNYRGEVTYYRQVAWHPAVDDDEIVGPEVAVSTEQFRPHVKLAADTLLSRPFPSLVVLEGAPGQGKSTITQYVCQVHRMRLLDKADQLELIPNSHRDAGVKLPFKVDLRDLAAWLSRRNPFSAEGEEITLQTGERTLEGFLAALVHHQSGGALFDVSDLHAVLRISAVIIVLDGLDEIADIKRRGEVVDEIGKAVERLQSIAASLQVIVTSRPTAFANSPGLSDKIFHTASLDAVTEDLINEYAAKWLKARKLEQREASDVRRILREKLNQPHMRDLARNPMQLAILLSLIHTQGTSLPDKRTALYDSYVRLFFNREAEKSEIVRENRDLLIDIHRYLAWLLHTEAEEPTPRGAERSNGAIEEGRLKEILSTYLKSEGHCDSTLPGKLFTGVVERVVALVSRVQGTYEFEVQPLREYFAARFLYDTAPYSPVGDEKRGTKPDRFDAIARDFYWLNVTRFYAGCYSKGELASLIDGLSNLAQDPEFKVLSHPRILAATLLSDWVFTQHPNSVSEVIRLVIDGIGLRFVLASHSRRIRQTQSFVLPPACGKSQLVAKCFEILQTEPPADFALDVIDLLSANAERIEIQPAWLEHTRRLTGRSRDIWLNYGVHLGCVSNIPATDLNELLLDANFTPERADLFLRARREDVIVSNAEYFSLTAIALLERQVVVSQKRRQGQFLDAFGQALDPSRYALAFRGGDRRARLDEIWARELGSINRTGTKEKQTPLSSPDLPEALKCKELIDIGIDLGRRESSQWATDLATWDYLVTAIIERFGPKWGAIQLANVSAAIKSTTQQCLDFPDLFDHSQSLCRRARYARLRAGKLPWWIRTFESAKTTQDKTFALLLWFTWASSKTLQEGIEAVDPIVAGLPEIAWQQLCDSTEEAFELTRRNSRERLLTLNVKEAPRALSPRTIALLLLRTVSRPQDKLLRRAISNYSGSDVRILKIFQSDCISNVFNSSIDWREVLPTITRAYGFGVLSPRFSPIDFTRRHSSNTLPLPVAKSIAENAEHYPSFLVAAAEAKCREGMEPNIRPVAKVSREERWFERP